MEITSLGRTVIKSITEDETKASRWYNTVPTGKLGTGDAYTVNIQYQDMDGRPGKALTTYIFQPKAGFFEKAAKLLKFGGEGEESNKERFGFIIYGKNTDGNVWTKGLPKAGPGSEPVDLGDWLDLVGGFREGQSTSDLLQDKKIADFFEMANKGKDALEKTNDALNAASEKKRIETRSIKDQVTAGMAELNTKRPFEVHVNSQGKPVNKTTVTKGTSVRTAADKSKPDTVIHY